MLQDLQDFRKCPECVFPHGPLQLPDLWEKEDTFPLQPPETERLAAFKMLKARPPWVLRDEDLSWLPPPNQTGSCGWVAMQT